MKQVKNKEIFLKSLKELDELNKFKKILNKLGINSIYDLNYYTGMDHREIKDMIKNNKYNKINNLLIKKI